MRHLDLSRIRAVVAKELRDYRRKRAIVVAMIILPVLFLVEPSVALFAVPASTSVSDLHHYVILPLLYLLLLPVIMPSTLAAYTVAGERENGTLEPLLTTPIRTAEFIAGKGIAVMIPTLILSYGVYGIFLLIVALVAHADVASAVFHQGPVLLALILFAPLVAGWSIVVGMAVSVRANEVRVAQQLGMAVSVRANEVRVAQQLGMLASFPIIGVVALLAVGVVKPTFATAAIFALILLVIDVRALRFVAKMFDRERLVTGSKAVRR